MYRFSETRHQAIAIAIVFSCLAAPAQLLGIEAARQAVTDPEIANVIQRKLRFDPAVSAIDINVHVTDGVATLTGSVSNILAKDRAGRIAEMVKGVESVVNRITVQPAIARSDEEITRDINRALLVNPATDADEVMVSVDDGVVTLDGTAPSWTQKQLYGTVAKGVSGVLDLNNRITVQVVTERPDAEIQPEVEEALRWDVLVDHALIDVSVDDGVVALTGTVGSASEKRRARHRASVAGVTTVDATGLEVARWARDEDLRQDKYEPRLDEEVEQAINNALLYDPRVASFNVDPSVVDGRVTLRGEVDNLQAKRAAEQVARQTVGVTEVINRLAVRPTPDRDDAEIAQDVREALRRDPYVDRRQVDVSVMNGVAHLVGTVNTSFERSRAEQVASTTPGVLTVRNALSVQHAGPLAYSPYLDDDYVEPDRFDYEPPPADRPDRQIKQDIENQLWWSPFVDEDAVTVRVADGRATLTGVVDSWSEYTAATRNAYEGGAVWVNNQLRIR